jgi:hypothetical protein
MRLAEAREQLARSGRPQPLPAPGHPPASGAGALSSSRPASVLRPRSTDGGGVASGGGGHARARLRARAADRPQQLAQQLPDRRAGWRAPPAPSPVAGPPPASPLPVPRPVPAGRRRQWLRDSASPGFCRRPVSHAAALRLLHLRRVLLPPPLPPSPTPVHAGAALATAGASPIWPHRAAFDRNRRALTAKPRGAARPRLPRLTSRTVRALSLLHLRAWGTQQGTSSHPARATQCLAPPPLLHRPAQTLRHRQSTDRFRSI